jgi:integrase
MYINTPKTDKSRRDIAFTDRVRDILLDIHKRRNDIDYYGKRNADISMRDQIFLNSIGGYADTGTVEKAFKRFLKRIGIDNSAYTMHTLRHTFVTRGIEKGADIKAVSEIVGHTSVEFTLNRYGHVLDEHMRNVMTVLLEDV